MVFIHISFGQVSARGASVPKPPENKTNEITKPEEKKAADFPNLFQGGEPLLCMLGMSLSWYPQ